MSVVTSSTKILINYFPTDFSVETIAGKASTETLLLVRGTADVVAASN